MFGMFKTVTSLAQLTNKDHKNLRETFIFRLSKIGSLKQFRRIILFSSPDDDFVPWHSARVSMAECKENSGSEGEMEMINKLLG